MRNVWLMVLVFSSLAVAAQPYSGDSWKKTQEQHHGVITLAYIETPGVAFKDSYGRMSGICVDILNDFVKYLYTTRKVELTWTTMGDGKDFKSMYDSVRNSVGGVFGLGSITITEERKKQIAFSPPFLNSFATLVTQSKVPMLTSLSELPNRFSSLTAYTDKGTINDKRFAELKQKFFPRMKVVYTSNCEEVVERVIADPNSFAYLDLACYLEAVQLGKPLKRHSTGDGLPEQFGFAMPLNSDWGPVLDEFFKANGGYTNSLRYQVSLNRHFGETGVRLLKKATGK